MRTNSDVFSRRLKKDQTFTMTIFSRHFEKKPDYCSEYFFREMLFSLRIDTLFSNKFFCRKITKSYRKKNKMLPTHSEKILSHHWLKIEGLY